MMGNWELFGLLGVACGVGILLGWCFIHSKGPKGSQDGGKQKVLIDFLQHFCDEWGIRPLVTLSDKDFSEINVYSNVFPFAKHQLCFWHCLRAVKKCLAVNGRQPGFYHVGQAWEEFPFIHEYFVPLAQRGTLPKPEVHMYSNEASYYWILCLHSI